MTQPNLERAATLVLRRSIARQHRSIKKRRRRRRCTTLLYRPCLPLLHRSPIMLCLPKHQMPRLNSEVWKVLGQRPNRSLGKPCLSPALPPSSRQRACPTLRRAGPRRLGSRCRRYLPFHQVGGTRRLQAPTLPVDATRQLLARMQEGDSLCDLQGLRVLSPHLAEPHPPGLVHEGPSDLDPDRKRTDGQTPPTAISATVAGTARCILR